LINWGTNHWSFKPEQGYSPAMGKWVLDGYLGVWFLTRNSEFWSRNVIYRGNPTENAVMKAFDRLHKQQAAISHRLPITAKKTTTRYSIRYANQT